MQRRRNGTAGGGLAAQMMPRPVAMHETSFEAPEFFSDALESVSFGYEPDSYFYYDDGFDLPDRIDASLHLEL